MIIKAINDLLKKKEVKEEDPMLRQRMKMFYWIRLGEKLKANDHVAFTKDECDFLLKVHESLTWSFYYGNHSNKDKYIDLVLRSEKHNVEFSTKGLVSVQTIFRDYDRIFDAKCSVGLFFVAINKLYNQAVSYCNCHEEARIEDFDTLIYDDDIYIRIGAVRSGVLKFNYHSDKYGITTADTVDSIFKALEYNYILNDANGNVVFKMVARDNGSRVEEERYEIKYIYER